MMSVKNKPNKTAWATTKMTVAILIMRWYFSISFFVSMNTPENEMGTHAMGSPVKVRFNKKTYLVKKLD